MAHCNDKACTSSTRYLGATRVCTCGCSTCAQNEGEAEPATRAERGTCESCGARIGPSDEFCEACGKAISESARAGAIGRANDEVWDRNQKAATTAKAVSTASRTIGWLALLFGASGVVMWVMHRDTARVAMANLARFASDDVIALEGKQWRVSELRMQIEAEPTQILAMNLTLAAILVALWIWSKKSALPAIATALAVLVGVMFVSFLVEPKSLFQGILVKVIAIGALVGGLRSALVARAVEQPSE